MARRAFSQVAPRVWNDLPIEIHNSVPFYRFRSASRSHYNIGLLLTITVHLDHVTVSAPTIRRPIGIIKERQRQNTIIQ